MADLIDRQTLLGRLEDIENSMIWDAQNCALLFAFRKFINKASAVDAAEVVHGRWVWKPINKYTSRLHCSVCDNDYGADGKYNYCPNCGAKMDGERREENAAD